MEQVAYSEGEETREYLPEEIAISLVDSLSGHREFPMDLLPTHRDAFVDYLRNTPVPGPLGYGIVSGSKRLALGSDGSSYLGINLVLENSQDAPFRLNSLPRLLQRIPFRKQKYDPVNLAASMWESEEVREMLAESSKEGHKYVLLGRSGIRDLGYSATESCIRPPSNEMFPILGIPGLKNEKKQRLLEHLENTYLFDVIGERFLFR